ncbi:MAG: polysaccharide deacetylase [Acidobacteria bacterium]|nr:MAG: polysaccharide deacetylase [Acidobacteriota bacterium]
MKRILPVALLFCMPLPAQPPAPSPLPGTKLSIDQVKEQFFRVSAGRRLKPKSWPNGARVAVALSFDVDNATSTLAQGETGANELSRGEYGAIDGLPRILRLLDKFNIPASFFIPAVSDALHPQMVRDILARERHEIGVHGWIHERLPVLNDEAEERRLLHDAIEHLTKSMGKRPVGYRAPSWAFSRYTMQQLQEAGFLYDSSLMASDDAYEILVAGKPSGMIELPIEWIVDDYPYFGGTNGSLPSSDLVEKIYESEFDVAYGEGGLFVLTMHPHVIGHRSRAAALEKLITHMKSQPGVWFATHEQVARYLKSELVH